MLLLTETQVQPCQVLRQNIFEQTLLPGLSYQNRLFFRIGQYALNFEEEARRQALAAFQAGKEQFLILVVRRQDQWTLWQEDPELQYCPGQLDSAEGINQHQLEQLDLNILGQRIRHSQALEIRDRRQGLKLHRRCFRGDQLLDCLVKQYNLDRHKALRLAQRLIDETQIYQLQHARKFEDSKALYRFYDDEL